MHFSSSIFPVVSLLGLACGCQAGDEGEIELSGSTLVFGDWTVTIGEAVVAITPEFRQIALMNVEDTCAALADCHSAVALPGEEQFLKVLIDGVVPDGVGSRPYARAELSYLDFPDVVFERYVNDVDSGDFVEMTTISEGEEEATIDVTFVASDRIGDQEPLDPPVRLKGRVRARECFVDVIYCEPAFLKPGAP